MVYDLTVLDDIRTGKTPINVDEELTIVTNISAHSIVGLRSFTHLGTNIFPFVWVFLFVKKTQLFFPVLYTVH